MGSNPTGATSPLTVFIMALSPTEAKKLNPTDLQLVTTIEQTIDNALKQGYDEGKVVTVSLPKLSLVSDRVKAEVKMRYKSAGWANLEFVFYYAGQFEDYSYWTVKLYDKKAHDIISWER